MSDKLVLHESGSSFFGVRHTKHPIGDVFTFEMIIKDDTDIPATIHCSIAGERVEQLAKFIQDRITDARS